MDEFLVQSLIHGQRNAQIQAATELSKLSSRQRHKLAEKGVIAPLISMLQSQDCDAIEAALFALLSLAFGSERNKVLIVKSGAIPVFLELLQCESGSLTENVLAALLTVSSSTANKMVIASSGAILHLVEILGRDYANNDNANNVSIQAKLDAMATLHNLSTRKQIIPLIVSSDVILTLLQLIHSHDKSLEVVEKALILLEHIVASSETGLMQVTTMGGGIRALVEVIEEGSAQCKEHAVAILLLICQSCREKYRGLILHEGVMPGLLELSVDGTGRAKDMAQQLLLLLRDCSRANKQSKHQLLEQIMQEIDAEEEETVMGTTTLRLVEEMIAKLNT